MGSPSIAAAVHWRFILLAYSTGGITRQPDRTPMNAALLAITLLLPPQDTVAQSLTADTTPQSFAPTLANTSALASIGPVVLGDSVAAADDSVRRRRKAVEYSDLYYTSLKVHRLASYLTLPLFVGQYLSGTYIWNHPGSRGFARDVHGPLAAGVAGLFAVNTVTGVYNLYTERHEPKGRARRWVHGLTMLVADAGFVVVGATAPHREDRFGGTPTPLNQQSGARTHRDVAYASMGLALGSYVMMLLWKD
jgi:hypothetical protein